MGGACSAAWFHSPEALLCSRLLGCLVDWLALQRARRRAGEQATYLPTYWCLLEWFVRSFHSFVVCVCCFPFFCMLLLCVPYSPFLPLPLAGPALERCVSRIVEHQREWEWHSPQCRDTLNPGVRAGVRIYVVPCRCRCCCEGALGASFVHISSSLRRRIGRINIPLDDSVAGVCLLAWWMIWCSCARLDDPRLQHRRRHLAALPPPRVRLAALAFSLLLPQRSWCVVSRRVGEGEQTGWSSWQAEDMLASLLGLVK